ncbi:MAG: metal-sulfur cluster assembly factor [Ginsengibacter sp.]
MIIITNNEDKLIDAIVALKEVEDPEIGLNVVDLGLIYQVDFDDANKKIYCTMTLTTQFCPMGESISNSVNNVLEQAFPDDEINVNVIFEPPWNSQKISATGREFLNS